MSGQRAWPAPVGLGIEQPVQVHDEIAHLRIVDGLLRLGLPGGVGGRIVRIDADDSTLSRSLNSVASSLLSSPPNTRWSNCFCGVGADIASSSTLSTPGAQRYTGSLVCARMRSASAACRSRPAASSDAVDRIGPVVDQNPAVERGQHAAGFVHQKVGSRKVPVVAVAAGDGGVELACGHAGEPQRQRMNARHRHNAGAACSAIRSSMLLGPGDAGAVEAGAGTGPDRRRRCASRRRPRSPGTARRSPARRARRAPAGRRRPAPPTPTSPRGRR